MKRTTITLLMSTLLMQFIVFFSVQAQSWTMPRDSQGWTILNPSTDSRLIYVSENGNDATARPYSLAEVGGDARDPQITVNAYATATAAFSQIRDTYPDWVLFKRGDEINLPDTRIDKIGVGRSKTERIVVTYYGTSGSRPVLKTDGQGIVCFETSYALTHSGIHNWAFIGLEFYGYKADPNSPSYDPASTGTHSINLSSGAGDYLLFEDCWMHYHGVDIMGNSTSNWGNVEFRRNIVTDGYYANSCNDNWARPAGTFFYLVTNFLVEENFYDHNGWNETVPNAGRNMYNHNMYNAATNSGDLVSRGNIFARASSHGAQWRSGVFCEMDLHIQNPAGTFVANDGGSIVDSVLIQNCVITEGLSMGTCPIATTANSGLAILANTPAGMVVKENIVTHNLNPIGTLVGLGLQPQSNNMGNIAYDWGNQNTPVDPTWLDPNRTVGSYNATIGGTSTTEAFLDACRNRALHSWDYQLTAYSVVDYIREGFNLSPVGPGSVTSIPVTSVSVSPTSLSLAVSQTSDLTETVLPANATNKNVTWSSSNSSVASVNSTGLVTAVAQGSATITVTSAENSSLTAICNVSVSDLPSGTNLALNQPVFSSSDENSNYVAVNAVDGSGSSRWASQKSDPQWIYVDLGAVYNISRVVLNWEVAYGQAYQIQVSDDASSWTDIYSTTTSDGGIDDLTGLSGTGRYVRMYGTARATSWGYSLWEFEVYGGSTVVPVTGVSVSPTSLTLNINDTQNLTATISPSNATNQNVSWTSSNSNIATVNATGLVTAITDGTATITVTTQDGNHTATCNVTVNPTGNLIGYWSFDETSGTIAYDGSPNGNDATLEGGATFVSGKENNAVSFNGTTSWVDIPDQNITGDFTIMAWVYLQGSLGLQHAIVGQEGPGQDVNFYGSKLRLYSVPDVIVASTSTLSAVWTHCAITRSNSTLYLYMDGVQDATSTWTGAFIPKAIGRGNGGTIMNGMLDEVYLYDRALSGTEILNFYNSTKSGQLTGSVSHELGAMRLYPNPLQSGQLIIDFGAKRELVISISDLSGKEVYLKSINDDRVEIDRNLFKSGIYIITVEGEENIQTQKLVVW